MTTPDPNRLGGIDWLDRTRGALTGAEKRRLLRAVFRGQGEAVAGRLALLFRRRATAPMAMPMPPDSALARDAEDAAALQSPSVRHHAYRTWAFGRALATVDGESVDEELFYVSALLHDAGIEDPVPSEDFTIRSGAAAAAVVERHRSEGHDDVACVRNAISAHVTPGASLEIDGAEGFYVQAGAVLDLGGLRLNHLSADLVDAVNAAHSRESLFRDFSTYIRAEAAAVPDGRFALLHKTGFVLALRTAPLPK
ncbi:MAG: hypothetical protein AAF548_16845 [Actinomycetota bacterium]